MPNNQPFIWQPHCFVYNISVFFDDNRDNRDNILYGREDVVPVVMSLRDICSLSLVVNVVSVVVKEYCRKENTVVKNIAVKRIIQIIATVSVQQ